MMTTIRIKSISSISVSGLNVPVAKTPFVRLIQNAATAIIPTESQSTKKLIIE